MIIKVSGHLRGGVVHNFTDSIQIRSLFQHMRGKGMPETMKGQLFWKICPVYILAKHILQTSRSVAAKSAIFLKQVAFGDRCILVPFWMIPPFGFEYILQNFENIKSFGTQRDLSRFFDLVMDAGR